MLFLKAVPLIYTLLTNLLSGVIVYLLGKNGREFWIKSQALSQHIKKF